jgi:hypothetical protein
VSMAYRNEVEDEAGLFEGDFVTLTVNLSRVNLISMFGVDIAALDDEEERKRTADKEKEREARRGRIREKIRIRKQKAAAKPKAPATKPPADPKAPVANSDGKAPATPSAAAPADAAKPAEAAKPVDAANDGKADGAAKAAAAAAAAPAAAPAAGEKNAATAAPAAAPVAAESKSDESESKGDAPARPPLEVAEAEIDEWDSEEDDDDDASGGGGGAGGGADDDDEELDDEKVFALAQAPKKKKHLMGGDDQHVSVHSVRFPLPKRERWYLLLIEADARERKLVIAQETITNFLLKHTSKFVFRVPPRKGVYTYELHLKCDSYVGCDQSAAFKLNVATLPPKIKEKMEGKRGRRRRAGAGAGHGHAHGPDGEHGDEDGGAEFEDGADGADGDREAEDAPEGKWYYLGYSSLWELLLTVVVVAALGLLAFDWLQRKGYWGAYVQPVVDRALRIADPALQYLHPIYSAVFAPM